jgi:hypothetical protein
LSLQWYKVRDKNRPTCPNRFLGCTSLVYSLCFSISNESSGKKCGKLQLAAL